MKKFLNCMQKHLHHSIVLNPSQNILSLQNVISIGAGEELVSEYRSVIFYHVGKPEWVETIKVNH